MFNRIPAIALGLSSFLMAACASISPVPTPTMQPTVSPPTLLPTAIPPDNVGGTWAVSFEYPFPPDFWNIGRHSYGFYIDCPLLMPESYGSEWIWFGVTDEDWMPEIKLPVYLRIGGISLDPLGPITIDTIAPAWSTIAVVTLLGLSEEDAKLATTSSDCVILINWDEVNTQIMTPGEPFQP